MACTKDEIERKRLAALQKRQSKLTIQNNALNYSPVTVNSQASGEPSVSYYQQPAPAPMKNYNYNARKIFHPYAKPENSTSMCTKMPISKVVSGTIYLISDNRFEVNPSEFCTPLINIFKSIPSRNYGKMSSINTCTVFVFVKHFFSLQ